MDPLRVSKQDNLYFRDTLFSLLAVSNKQNGKIYRYVRETLSKFRKEVTRDFNWQTAISAKYVVVTLFKGNLFQIGLKIK